MAKGYSIRKMASRAGQRFTVPLILAGMTTAAAILDIWSHDIDSTAVQALFCGLCFSVLGTLLAEALDKPRFRPLFSIAGAIPGILLMLCCSGTKNSENGCGLLALSAALGCCACISRGERRAERLSRALGCLLTCAGISALVFLLLSLLISAVRALFMDPGDWQTVDRLTTSGAALAGLLFAPFLLFALLPGSEDPEEKPGWLRWLAAYVVLPAYLILQAILVGYIAVILVRREMPVGQMNPYAITALCIYTALHLLLTGEENAAARFFRRWGAWPLLPVIAAQTVGVVIRVSAYGLTEARILGLALTAVCLYPVAAGLLRRRANAFFAVSAALALILTIPAASPRTLARLDQEARLYAALERADMLDADGNIRSGEQVSEADQRIIWSAARQLCNYPDDAPAGSRTADLIRQLDAADPEGKLYEAAKIRALVGFGDPAVKNIVRYFTAKGSFSDSVISVSGFSTARKFNARFTEKNGYTAELDGEILKLDTFLPLADFENERLIRDELTMDSGRTLRLSSLEKTAWYDETTYVLTGWLLTPEEKPKADAPDLDWYAPGAALYVPDLTGEGGEWAVEAVTAGEKIVRAAVALVDLNRYAEGAKPKPVYEILLEGVTPGDAYIWLDLRKDGEISWRYNLYVIVNDDLDVKIQYAELFRWPADLSGVQIDHGTSRRFSREDMDAAIAVILRDFQTGWHGITVHEISYTSDARSQQEFEKESARLADSRGRTYKEGIVFVSSFHTPLTDDGMTGFEAGEYSEYQWTLLRTEDGGWEIVNQGFC